MLPRSTVNVLSSRRSPRILQRFASSAAHPTSQPGQQVRNAAESLLPPVQLYRRLLRAHRDKLNPDMRSLGDGYIKDEFRRHQKIDNPLHIVGFLSQWKLYLDALEAGEADAGSPSAIGTASKKYFEGRRLDPEIMEKLSEEQLYQLYELMQVTRELYDPERAQAKPPGVTDES